MKEHALQSCFGERTIPREVSVLVIARQWESNVREMHADLMRAPGEEFRFEQRQGRIVITPDFDPPESRRGLAPEIVVHAHAPLPLARGELVEREPNRSLLVAPIAPHQHEIAFVHFAITQLAMKLDQRGTALRHDQHSRGLAIEPMHKLEETRLRPCGAKRLDQPMRHPAPPVHRQPGGLVHDDELVVLEDDRDLLRDCGAAPCRDVGGPHRRHADRVTGREAGLGTYALAVEANLARAQDPIDVTLRHAFQHTRQVVVDALAGRLLAYRQFCHRVAAQSARHFIQAPRARNARIHEV